MPRNKRPWWLEPSMGGRQAYMVIDEQGCPMVRQSMRTPDGRVVYLEMTPDEVSSLVHDLQAARDEALSETYAPNGMEYREARF